MSKISENSVVHMIKKYDGVSNYSLNAKSGRIGDVLFWEIKENSEYDKFKLVGFDIFLNGIGEWRPEMLEAIIRIGLICPFPNTVPIIFLSSAFTYPTASDKNLLSVNILDRYKISRVEKVKLKPYFMAYKKVIDLRN